MQFEKIKKLRIQLNRYELAISDILNNTCSLNNAATIYRLNKSYLSLFIHTITTKGRIIKGENKKLSFFDELAFLLYIKMCYQEHCICLECFEEYLPRLIYKFIKYNNLIYPQCWDTYRKADESTKLQFLERHKKRISSLFPKVCLRLPEVA